MTLDIMMMMMMMMMIVIVFFLFFLVGVVPPVSIDDLVAPSSFRAFWRSSDRHTVP